MTTPTSVRRWFAPVWLVAGALLLGGCAGVPTAQLQAYSDSYDQAKTGASLIYEDAAPAMRAGAPTESVPFPISLGPAKFDREGCGPIVASNDALRGRCQAMIALKLYNQALLDVAAGKNSNDILAQVDQAFSSLNTLGSISAGAAAGLAPLVAAVPALKAILGEVLKAQDRMALKSKLEAGAPTIREFIQAMRDDVTLLHKVHRAYAVLKLDAIQSAIDADLNIAKRTIAGSIAPTDQSVTTALRFLEQRFDAMFDSAEPSGGPQRLKGIAPAASGRPLDGAGIAVVEAQLAFASERVSEFKRAAAQYNKSIDALKQYDELLAAVDKSLTALLLASSQPFATGGGTDQAVQSILVIRDKAKDIKQLLASR